MINNNSDFFKIDSHPNPWHFWLARTQIISQDGRELTADFIIRTGVVETYIDKNIAKDFLGLNITKGELVEIPALIIDHKIKWEKPLVNAHLFDSTHFSDGSLEVPIGGYIGMEFLRNFDFELIPDKFMRFRPAKEIKCSGKITILE